MSPTNVYSSRSSEPRSAAATGPVESPIPSPNAGSPRSAHSLSSATCRVDHRHCGRERAIGVVFLRDRRAEARHHRVADELHDRAAVGEDHVVHGGAVLVELIREPALGSVVSAMPE